MMTGNTLECLRHFLVKEEAAESLAKFLGIKPLAVRKWKAESIPSGLNLIKTRYFLEQNGYCIAELGSLPEPTKKLGRLIALGYVDIESAYKEIGLDESSRLMTVLHGKRGVLPKRFEIIKQIVARYKDELDNISDVAGRAVVVDKAPQKPAVLPDNKAERETILLLSALKNITDLLGPRLEAILSDGVSAEQRRKFRDTAGRLLIFYLSNEFDIRVLQLNALCSEKSRELFNQSQNENRRKEK